MQIASEYIADYALKVSYEDLPPEVVDRTKRLLLDSLGCSLGAFTSPPSKNLRKEYTTRFSEKSGSTIIGSCENVPPEYAALINGTMVRYLDFNDTYNSFESGCHPSNHIPCLISVAEAEGSSGEELIESIVVSYELMCAGVETGAIVGAQTGFDHPTWGAFSTAASAGKLMGLSKEELIHAIGIAVTANNPLRIARLGKISNWKGITFGYVAHNAIQACQMAAVGITGPDNVFEGKGGFFQAVTGKPVKFEKLGGLNTDHYRILDASIKLHATGFLMQSAVSAALELKVEHDIDPEDIDSIDVYTFSHAADVVSDAEKKSSDLTRETADHSFPYTIAVALIDDKITPAQFTEDKLTDRIIHDLMDKITVREKKELTEYKQNNPTEIPNAVAIQTRDNTYEKRVNVAVGHPRKPMSDEQLEQKVTDLASAYLTENQIATMIDDCYHIDSQECVSHLIENTKV